MESRAPCGPPAHTAPPKTWAGHLNRPSGLNPAPTPTHTPCKESARLPPPPPPGPVGEQARELWSAAHPGPCCNRGARKALPEFTCRATFQFLWVKKAKGPGWYQNRYQGTPWVSGREVPRQDRKSWRRRARPHPGSCPGPRGVRQRAGCVHKTGARSGILIFPPRRVWCLRLGKFSKRFAE